MTSSVRPVRTSRRGARAKPESITIETPSTVREVSAISVDKMTRLDAGRPSTPNDRRKVSSCSLRGSDPASRWMVTLPEAVWDASRCVSSSRQRLISPIPGRKTRTSPSCSVDEFSASAVITASATRCSRRGTERCLECWPEPDWRRDDCCGRADGRYSISTGYWRPSETMMSAGPWLSPSTRAKRSASAVADIAKMAVAVPSARRASRRNASPKSVGTLRS